MNPFFFGRSERPLYGVYAPPRAASIRGGVLFCYPLGVEYMHAHRACRQFTTLMTRAGFGVLRFDYFGTGDSGGSGEDVSFAGMVGDAVEAVEELRANTGIDDVTVVGLRLGGAVAATLATRVEGLGSVVLWDPVTEGRRYVDELLPHGGSTGGARPRSTVGVGGFPLTPELLRGLDDWRVDELPALLAPSVDVVVSSPSSRYDALVDLLRERGVKATLSVHPSEGNWVVGDAFGSALIPQDIIQGVVRRVGGAEAA